MVDYHQRDGFISTLSSHKHQQISSPSLAWEADTVHSLYESVQFPCMIEGCISVKFMEVSFLSDQFDEPIHLPPAATLSLDFMQRDTQGKQVSRMGAERSSAVPFTRNLQLL